jgi:uncharacterized protein YndB with AHSA1/START domain
LSSPDHLGEDGSRLAKINGTEITGRHRGGSVEAAIWRLALAVAVRTRSNAVATRLAGRKSVARKKNADLIATIGVRFRSGKNQQRVPDATEQISQRGADFMSTSHMRFTAQIGGAPEVVFDLVADMPNYGRWLPDSDVFGGTVDVTPYPVRLGTTYLDAGPVEKPGSVTEFDPPRHISFHHTVLIRRPLLKTDIDARIRYTFEANQGGTFVLRELDLVMNLRGLYKLVSPIILWSFRKENVRTLAQLKEYVERQRKGGSDFSVEDGRSRQ